MSDAIKEMLAVWRESASRDTSVVAGSILKMTTDPIAVADLIAEAGQRDPSLMPSADAMDEINSIASDSELPETGE